MHIEDFRSYCLSFPGTEDKMPFDKATSAYDRGLLVFSVVGKWFCFVNVDAFDCCVIKCPTDRIEELREQYEGIRPGYHMNKRHWISVRFHDDVPDDVIRMLVRQSYDLVVASLPAARRAELSAGHE